MIHPKSTPPTVQQIIFRDLEKWKDPITELRTGKISEKEFKQFLVGHLNQIEADVVQMIRMMTNKKENARQILLDNLKTKAILHTVLEHPALIESLRKTDSLPATSASSISIPTVEVGEH